MKSWTYLILFAAVLVAAGCESKLQDGADLPTEPRLNGAHPPEFVVMASSGFHGKVLAARNNDLSECMRCHGTDLKGGITKQSCMSSGCHAHPAGFITLAAPVFHGRYLAGIGHDMSRCSGCHGVDFDGGSIRNSCNASGCHNRTDGGPAACYTCHGDVSSKKPYPQVPASHIRHIEGSTITAVKVACAGCHTVPAVWNAPGHLDGANPTGAEVLITDAMAATKTKGTVGEPQYDASTGACRNVYCHGNFTNGNNYAAKWTGGANEAKCGTCHGDPATGNPLPKAPHPQMENCSACHAGVVDADRKIIDPSKHINGKLNSFGGERTDW